MLRDWAANTQVEPRFNLLWSVFFDSGTHQSRVKEPRESPWCPPKAGDIRPSRSAAARLTRSMTKSPETLPHQAATEPVHHRPGKSSFWKLTLGSIGVVYGDIGTSPLYAFREAAKAAAGTGTVDRDIVLGVLSLILWSLIIVVTLKYVIVLLQADNNGEGGTLSLTALAFRALGGRTRPVLILGIIGAAMFYGSSFITPALSVLSAIEGLKVATPRFEAYVLPLTVIILVALFALQSRGTGRIATFFGPIMVIWFLILAIAGLVQILQNPGVLIAMNPVYALGFLSEHPGIGLVTLGFVLLAVTGGEA